jgi:nitrate/nitrite-specific signal transduction histidine kinase
MNIFSKILITLLPLVTFLVFVMGGINYYFSTRALNRLAEIWLSGKLTVAMQILNTQEKNLRMYGLEAISASKAKAQIDAGKSFLDIDMGNDGYLFATDSLGVIVMHSDENKIGKKLKDENWFRKAKNNERKSMYFTHTENTLAISEYFEPWDLFVFAADPVEDFYGPANKIKPYLFILGGLGSIMIAIVLMFLTRRIMLPLKSLTEGVKEIGKGNLETRVIIHSNDEFSLLAQEFNSMTQNLQNITVSRDHLEIEIAQKKELEKEKEKVIENLTAALEEIKTLKGIVPICSGCKKIRDDEGYWNVLEAYIQEHTDASFSHGMCPECMEDFYGKEDWYIKRKKE